MKLAEVLWGPEVWCRGDLRKGTRVCVLGGVLKVSGAAEVDWSHPAVKRLARLIRSENIGFWNDDPARTWDEVAAVVSEYDRLTMLEEG